MSDLPTPPSGFKIDRAYPPLPAGYTRDDVALDAPIQPASIGARLLHGFEAPFVGTDVLASELEQRLPFVPKGTAEADLANSLAMQREWEKRSPAGFDWAEFVGDLANPLNYTVAGRARGLLGAALGGAGSAFVQPSSTKDYWTTKAEQVAEGAGVGAGMAGVGHAIGRAISPVVAPAAEILGAKNVPMTPGQMTGGVGRAAESALRSFPVLGTFIQRAEHRSIEGFNRSVINQALEPIGEQLPKTARIGHEAQKLAADKIGREFDRIYSTISFRVDPEFIAARERINQLATELTPAQQSQLANIINNRFDARLHDGALGGEGLQDADTAIRQEAEGYRKSQDPDHRKLGFLLTEFLDDMRVATERQNPKEAISLRNARSAYAMLARIEAAGGRRAGSEAIFTPLDLLAAIRSASTRVRRRDFVHGDALLQAFAEAAHHILPETIPDSGTAGRLAWNALLAGGAWLHQPAVLLPEALIPFYTERGGGVAQRYLLSGETRRQVADTIARAIKRTAPATSVLYSQGMR